MVNLKMSLLLAFSALLTGCTHHIKNDLALAIGDDVYLHEVYYGKPVKITESDHGTTRRYENKKTGCIYELDLNNSNVVTKYRFISKEEICALPLNWGGPW